MGFASLVRALGVRIVAALAAAAALASPAGAATYAKGVDVSHYQGIIDWTAVAGQSYRFTFAKATEGTTYVDATYPVNRAGAEGMGLRFGAYHFGRPGGSGASGIAANAIAQADHFVADRRAPERRAAAGARSRGDGRARRRRTSPRGRPRTWTR